VEDRLDVADSSSYKVKMGMGIDHMNADGCESVGEESGVYQIGLRRDHRRQET
jgi:hypothetical protein